MSVVCLCVVNCFKLITGYIGELVMVPCKNQSIGIHVQIIEISIYAICVSSTIRLIHCIAIIQVWRNIVIYVEGIVKVLSVFEIFLVTYGSSEIWNFCKFFWHFRNHLLHFISLVLSTFTLQSLRTLVMEILKIQDCQADIVRAAKINIMDLQKLDKDCLSDIVKCY